MYTLYGTFDVNRTRRVFYYAAKKMWKLWSPMIGIWKLHSSWICSAISSLKFIKRLSSLSTFFPSSAIDLAEEKKWLLREARHESDLLILLCLIITFLSLQLASRDFITRRRRSSSKLVLARELLLYFHLTEIFDTPDNSRNCTFVVSRVFFFSYFLNAVSQPRQIEVSRWRFSSE